MKFSPINLSDTGAVKKLVKACVKGDRNSQQKLYQMFYGKMLAICVRYTDDIDQAKDILHDGFLKVFANLKNFGFKGSLEGWIRRIIVNNAIDTIRKKRDILTDFTEEDDIIKDDSNEEEQDEMFIKICSKLNVEKILELIKKLSPVYRTVFNLHVIEKYSHQQIAEKLNISEGTSKSNLAKAKKRLRKLILEYIREPQQQTRKVIK